MQSYWLEYLDVGFTKLLDVNVGVVISERINGRSSETQPSDEDEKLREMQNVQNDRLIS
jgi:hypothetical protein